MAYQAPALAGQDQRERATDRELRGRAAAVLVPAVTAVAARAAVSRAAAPGA